MRVIAVTARRILEATGGRLVCGADSGLIVEISTDTRDIRHGALFIPLQGERFDGHAFIEEAMARGAAGFLTEPDNIPCGESSYRADAIIIEVEDTLVAYGRIARLIREMSGATVVAITGSTGKTSTKDLLFALTGKGPETIASSGNYNNEIGLPLTLLNAELGTKNIIVEMGMCGPGQIANLSEYARPDVGVITNIGLTHLELLGSQEGIAAAKSELAAAISTEGAMVLNHDDPWTPFIRERTKGRVITFGLRSGADYSITDLSFSETARPNWRLVVNGKSGPLMRLTVPGLHNVVNSLAAIAAASVLGIRLGDMAERLVVAVLTKMRLNLIETSFGITVVDDTYNANPTSMAGALDTLARIRPGARHIAVLGKMAELGSASVREHRELGVKAAGLLLDILVGVGEETAVMIDSATASGLAPEAVRHFVSRSEAVDWLRAHMSAGDVVLVKGSRAAGLEEVVAGLSKES